MASVLSFPTSQPILTSTAKVVDGRLVLSLTDAQKPVVWQFDLSVAKSSAIELRETNGGETTLILKTAKQDVQDIATYDTHDKAVRALFAISRAMERASGQMHAPLAGTYPPPALIPSTHIGNFTSALGKAFWGLTKTLIILFIIFMAIIWFAPSADQRQTPTTQNSESLTVPAPAPTQSGTGQSADDFLNSLQ
jgi:hypothetical protein